MPKSQFLFAIAAISLACVCSAQPTPQKSPQEPTPQAPLQNPIQDESYRIQAEDVISVLVQDMAEASGSYSVGKDGRINIPIGGELQVAGKTRKEIAAMVVQSLKKEIRNPVVTVNVTSSAVQRISVLGTIASPGVKDYKPKWRLMDLVASSGGLASDPLRTKAVIFRPGMGSKVISMRKLLIDGDDTANVEVFPGDIINFTTEVMVRVNVVGRVARQGPIEVPEGKGIAEVLAAAGGGAGEARLSGIKLVRNGKEIPIDAYAIVNKGNPSLNQPVQDGDTIYIPDLLNKISIFGMVGRPGPMPLPDGKTLTLTEAIAAAGGPTRTAKTDGVSIVRKGTDGRATFQNYNLKAFLKGDKKFVDPLLQDGDIVVIAQSGKGSFGEYSQGVSVFGFLSRFIFPF